MSREEGGGRYGLSSLPKAVDICDARRTERAGAPRCVNPTGQNDQEGLQTWTPQQVLTVQTKPAPHAALLVQLCPLQGKSLMHTPVPSVVITQADAAVLHVSAVLQVAKVPHICGVHAAPGEVGTGVGVAVRVHVRVAVNVAGRGVCVGGTVGGGESCGVGVGTCGVLTAVGGAPPPQTPTHGAREASQSQRSPPTHVPLSCWQVTGPTKLANDVSIHRPPLGESNAQQPVGLHDPVSPVAMSPSRLLSVASMQIAKAGHAVLVNRPGRLTQEVGGTIAQVTVPLEVVVIQGWAGGLATTPQADFV